LSTQPLIKQAQDFRTFIAAYKDKVAASGISPP